MALLDIDILEFSFRQRLFSLQAFCEYPYSMLNAPGLGGVSDETKMFEISE